MKNTSEFPRTSFPCSFQLKDNKTISVITVFRWEQGCEEPSHALASPFHLSSPLRYRCSKIVTPLALSLARPPPPRRLPSLLPDRRLPWSHALGMALHQRYNHKVMLLRMLVMLMMHTSLCTWDGSTSVIRQPGEPGHTRCERSHRDL